MQITVAMLFTSQIPPMLSVNNFKAYSSKKWTDGIDTFNASYITINDYLYAY